MITLFELAADLAAVLSKKGAGFPCHYWIYTISHPNFRKGPYKTKVVI